MWEKLEQPWAPVSKPAVIVWLVFYTWFLWTFWVDRGFLLLFDNVNLIVHEAGHLLFGYTGSHFLTALGGTVLQLIVPAGLCFHFALQRQPYGTAFCAFVFFQNFLGIGLYMADARSHGLALVAVGAVADESMHDWTFLFNQLGLIQYDIGFGRLTRFLGWVGMLATMGWLLYRYRNNPSPPVFEEN